MKKTTKLTAILFGIFALTCTVTWAQDEPKKDKTKEKVTIEEIKPVCEGLAQDKKPRLTVANFKLTAPNAPKDQYGDNLATMLTNALQKVQCYRVLERVANMQDVDKEIEYQEKNATKKSTVKRGKQMGANVIVQGEITEFEQSESGAGFAIVKTKNYKAKVGLIIRLVDPETREVIATESFNVEKKTGGGLKVGVPVPYLGDLNLMSTAFKNPAVQDATENCIVKAVQYIAGQKDKVNMPANGVADGATQYTFAFKNIDYDQYSNAVAALGKIQGVSNVEGDDFEDGTGNITFATQTVALKEVVAKLIMNPTCTKLSVSGMSKDGATFTKK